MADLIYIEAERPIVAQLFSSHPEYMEGAARLCAELGFDGIDINMGCPDKTIEKQGCGSALIKDPERAVRLIRAAKRGAKNIPVSVKTRAGYKSDDELDAWVTTLLKEDIAALTLHARTRKDLSLVPARWELVKRAVDIRNAVAPHTKILGNGDALSIADAREKAAYSGADGVMLGRAIFGNPWLFSEYVPTPHERVDALIRHLELFQELLSGITHFAVMKKHFKAYISGWDHAKELRVHLMATESVEEAISLLRSHTLE
jgi:tRNA-dihydrouridine synthase